MSTPTAVFPAAVATDAQLKVANNQVTTTLKVNALAGDTILFVNSTAGFTANCLVSIDKEIAAVDSVVASPNPQLIVNPAGRGFDGTSAATHAAGAKVSLLIDAWHHNVLSAEVKAIESFIGPNGQNIAGPSSLYIADQYDFTQTPGGSLTVGVNMVTLSPPPAGMGVGSSLYITGGTGTSEAVPVQSWNPATGAAIINCAYTHTGAWTISSASDGIQEAINVAAANNGTVLLKAKTYNVQGTILAEPGTVIHGSGKADEFYSTYPGGTMIDGSTVAKGYVFDYLSPVSTSAYGFNTAFVFRDFSLKTGLNGIRLNNDTLPIGTNNQAFLSDNVVIENVAIFGGKQYTSDPNKNTNVVPAIATLKSYGVGINLTLVYRARIIDCNVQYFGVPFLVYGDENLIEGCLANINSIGVYLWGIDPNGTLPLYGNKNIVRHVKFSGLTRLPAIWSDSCGGTFVENCYFEVNQNQYARVTNSMAFTFGPNNWVQSAGASPPPSFHIDVSQQAVIHNNTVIQGANIMGQVEMDYTHYATKYPNIVRMWNNDSYFPQPGNRSWLGGGSLTTFPLIPGILVAGQPNSLLLNAYNNPTDWAYGSASFPWVQDPVTHRWVVNSADAIIAVNGFGAWFRPTGRLYRTFNILISARSTGTGTCTTNVVYQGNANTTLFTGNLTFTTTAETSVQQTGNVVIPAGETLGGNILVVFAPTGCNVEQVLVVPVS
jgi:hypothetical protein